MRGLCQDCQTQSWDTPLTEIQRLAWISFFHDLFDIEQLQFPRCVKPPNAVGKPILVFFSDGSSQAYGACAYIYWMLSDKTFKSNLIMAKNRIAPVKQLTIPRLELCGAILSARLKEVITQSMEFKFERTYHLVDSRIVQAQIQRVAEIQEKTNAADWFWIASEDNIADLTTRPIKPQDLSKHDSWLFGPPFLQMPCKEWPIHQTSGDVELPEMVKSDVSLISFMIKKPKLELKFENFNSYYKLLKVTATLLRVIANKSFKGAHSKMNATNIQEAELYLIKSAQATLPENAIHEFHRLGPTINSDGLIVVGGRIASWLKDNWNTTSFFLIPNNHPLARLIVTSIHKEDHAGIEVILVKIQRKFWIPGVRRIIKIVKHQCVICRRRDKNVISQQMGGLPPERLTPSPAFYHCACDLFGPFTIRDTVKMRTHGKAYGVLFNCLSSRAVYIDLAEGYDMESFIMVLRRFTSVRGYPATMISDAGSQLVATGKELGESIRSWKWEDIEKFGHHRGMIWKFIKSADAPWENGESEALIKSTKRCLEIAVGESILTFSELQTVLFEVANLLNQRPIGTKTTNPNEGSYLCPNDLILGRASPNAPTGNWSEEINPRIRWKFDQQVIDSFWRKWMRDYFPFIIC